MSPQGESGTGSGKDDLREYLRLVSEELARRESALAAVESKKAELVRKLKDIANRKFSAVEAIKLGSMEAYRRKLQGELERKEAESASLRKEVEKARERRASAEEELEASVGHDDLIGLRLAKVAGNWRAAAAH